MSWHNSLSVNQAVHEFHDSFAKFPRNKVKTTTKNITPITQLVQNHLQKDFARPVRYKKIGSTFEGTSIGNPLSFDLYYIVTYMETDLEVSPIENVPGHVLMSEVGNKKAGKAETPRKGLSAQEFSEKFLFSLYDLKSSSAEFTHIKVITRGTNCTTLEVSKNGKVAFEMCIIPGMEICPDKGPIQYYVPKVSVRGSEQKVHESWVMTFCHVEKDIFMKMNDKDARKQCVRIVKALRDQDDLLVDLRSPVIKNVVMKQREQGEWTERSLGLRVLRCLQVLSTAYHTGKLRSVMDQSVDLLEELTLEQKSTIYGRLNQLISDKEKFMTAIKPKPCSHGG